MISLLLNTIEVCNKKWLQQKGDQDDICHAKEAFKRKISLLKSKLNIEFRKNWLDVFESLQIKVVNKELKEVDNFKYLGTRNGYSTREIR